MVDDNREASAGARLENLGNWGAVMHGVQINQRWANGCHRSRLVDEAHLDHVTANHPCVNSCVDSRARQRVDAVDDVQQRIDARCVFQLHKANHVGVQLIDGLEQFIALARELGCAVGAAALLLEADRTALGRIVIKRQEVVEHVEAGNRDASLHRRRGCRSRVGWLEDRRAAAQRIDRTQAIGVAAGRVAGPGVAQQSHHVADRIAAAQGVGCGQRIAAAGEFDGVGVLDVEFIVDDDTVQVVGLLEEVAGAARSAGQFHMGGLQQAVRVRRDHGLTKAAKLEVFSYKERLGEAHQHPLETLQVVHTANGRGEGHHDHGGRDDRAAANAQLIRSAAQADLRLILKIGGVAGHPH